MSNQQDTKKKNPNVPNLRFSGYEGSWNKVALCEVANIIGGGTPDTSNPLYWNGDIDWFTPTEVGESKYVNESKRKITYAGLKSSSAKLLPRGSILLSTRASVGLASITTNPQGVTTNQGFQSVVPKRVEDSEFLYYVISNQNTQRELKTKANGSTFPEISNSKVSSIIVSLPPDPKERFEISRFLATIDERIRLQNKIIEEKKREIIVLNDELYSHAIKTIHGFADIADNYSGLSGKNSEDFGKGASYITYLNVLNNRYIDKSSCGYVTIHKNEKQNTVLYGDVILTLSSETPEEVGVSSVYLGNDTLYLNSFCFGIRFKTEETVLPEYATWLFSTTAFRKHIYPFAQGSTRYNLNLGSFMKSSFAFPSVDDQRRFAGLLNRLEESTKLEIKMLDELKLAKSFLLQQLFI